MEYRHPPRRNQALKRYVRQRVSLPLMRADLRVHPRSLRVF
jgi:hypothetical protein